MAVRPIWNGAISFGLVNIPVTLYSAEQRSDISFRMVDRDNMQRIRFQRVNEKTGEEVPYNRISRGYEYSRGQYVLISDEDLKKASVKATKTVPIEDFVNKSDVEEMFFDRPYYLVPDKNGEKGYVLLREALKKSGKTGIAKVVIHSRQHLAALFPRDDALILNLLRFSHEIRKRDEFKFPEGELKEYQISTKEMQMANQLVESMKSEWEPEKYQDDYRDALLGWIEQKKKSGEMKTGKQPGKKEKPVSNVIDITEMLRKSIKQEKGQSNKGGRKSKKMAKG